MNLGLYFARVKMQGPHAARHADLSLQIRVWTSFFYSLLPDSDSSFFHSRRLTQMQMVSPPVQESLIHVFLVWNLALNSILKLLLMTANVFHQLNKLNGDRFRLLRIANVFVHRFDSFGRLFQ